MFLKLTLATLAAVCSLVSISHAQTDIRGFNGLTWGTQFSMTELKTDINLHKSAQAQMTIYQKSSAEYMMVTAEVSYGFMGNDGFQWGRATITVGAERPRGLEILTKLLDRYGTPQSYMLVGEKRIPLTSPQAYIDAWRPPRAPGMPNTTELRWSDKDGDTLLIRLSNEIIIEYSSKLYESNMSGSDY